MTVTVYTKPTCQGCVATKRHLDKLGISYSIGSMDDIREAVIEQGILAAPVVVVQAGTHEQMWGGYRPDRLDALVS